MHFVNTCAAQNKMRGIPLNPVRGSDPRKLETAVSGGGDCSFSSIMLVCLTRETNRPFKQQYFVLYVCGRIEMFTPTASFYLHRSPEWWAEHKNYRHFTKKLGPREKTIVDKQCCCQTSLHPSPHSLQGPPSPFLPLVPGRI